MEERRAKRPVTIGAVLAVVVLVDAIIGASVVAALNSDDDGILAAMGLLAVLALMVLSIVVMAYTSPP